MENKKWYEGMYMMNRDPDWCLFIDDSSAESCRHDLERNFSEFVNGTSITDVAICTFCRMSYIPSLVFDWFPRRWMLYKDFNPETGEAWDEIPASIKRWEPFYKCYTEFNIDPVEIFLEQMNKYGARAWLSLRMNDVHIDQFANQTRDEDKAVGHFVTPIDGNPCDYYQRCIDYTYPRFRNMLLAYIKEVFKKYDFFGLELDFMREVCCFNYQENPDCHKIMTGFLREVRALVDKIGKEKGHDIKILIRLPRDPESAVGFGFDVKTIVNDNLVDAINPTPRWSNVDSAIPVRHWQEYVEDRVPIIPGLENLCTRYVFCTYENNKAYLAGLYGQGAVGAYIYNHFGRTGVHSLTRCISRESCLEGRREFIVTEQDTSPEWKKRYKPLPMKIDGATVLPLEIGKVKPNDNVTLIIDFEGETSPTVSVCQKSGVSGSVTEPLTALRADGRTAEFTPNTPLAYDLTGIETEGTFNLTFNGVGTVGFVKIIIDAK